MAWTTPRTWVTAEVVTAAVMNTHVRDNLLAIDTLVGIAGGTYTDGGILLGSGAAAITVLPRALTGEVPVGQAAGDPINRSLFVDGGADPKLRHENGGIEADISAITTGGLLRGSGAGAMAVLPLGATDGHVLTVTGGQADWALPSAEVISRDAIYIGLLTAL